MGKEDDMKSLVEEAGKMLRSMSCTVNGEAKGSNNESDGKIRSLQRQLDDLCSDYPGSMRTTPRDCSTLERLMPCRP